MRRFIILITSGKPTSTFPNSVYRKFVEHINVMWHYKTELMRPILIFVQDIFMLLVKLIRKILNQMFKLWRRIKKSHDAFLGIATLLITIVYGSWGIYLSKEQIKLSEKQDSTSLDLLHFAQLLKKTDSVIILSKDQLSINQKVQEIANINYANSEIGNMNRLLDKLHQIDTEFLNLNASNYSSIEPSENSLKELSSRLERLKILLVSEMNNPYINSNDTINELWSIAYSNVGELNQQIEFSLMYVGEKVLNLNTGKSEIGEVDTKNVQIVIKRIGYDIFTSLGALTGYTSNKIKKDKIRRGILDKNGKAKINPIEFYHH